MQGERGLLVLVVLVVLSASRTVFAAPGGAGDDELSDIERALGEDAAEVADRAKAEAPVVAADSATDRPHRIDIDTVDSGATWSEFAANWDLFRDPVLAAGIAGLVLGFLSVFVVLRRMVFVSAAVTQAAGFGVAASFLVSAIVGWTIDPLWGATGLSLLTAAAVAPDPRRLGLSREMVLGLAFAFFAGAAVIAGAKIPQEAHDIQAILFGTAVIVSRQDMHRLAVSGGAILLVQLWWFRGFSFASFDPLAARVQGLPVRLLDVLLLVCIGVSVGGCARALGALPAFALSVLPGVAAVQLARGPLIVTFLTAAVLGALGGVAGYIAAFFLELPVGATQTVLVGLVVVAATVAHAAGSGVRSLRRRL